MSAMLKLMQLIYRKATYTLAKADEEAHTYQKFLNLYYHIKC